MIADVRKILKEKKAIIGTKEVIRNLKLGKISKVFLTRNCPSAVKKDVEHYCSILGAEAVQLKETNEELGVICKKQFSISILGLRKGA